MPFLVFTVSFLSLFRRFLSRFILGLGFFHRTITLIEVEQHKNDGWIIIDDDVYCLALMKNHSGGLEIFKQLAGRDVTRIFHEVHLKSDQHKQYLNRKCWIGKIVRDGLKTEEFGYFLKKNSIHRVVPDCNEPKTISSDEESIMKELFRQYILSTKFPCLNAKIIFRRKAFNFGFYDILTSKETTELLWHDLIDFINRQTSLWINNHMLTTYVACFRTPKDVNEIIFEKLLWKQLRQLHEKDVESGMNWAENYSDDPLDPNFGFSIGGRAFFIVGLHPNSSRKARQFITPAIAFNSHDQFKNLRELNILTEIRQVIRKADLHNNGSINPNLIPNDDKSVAFEYSGKLIQPDWIPPFKSLHEKIN